jgi:hypothetical protein
MGTGIDRPDAVGRVGDSVATGCVATDPVATGGVAVAAGGVAVAAGGVAVAAGGVAVAPGVAGVVVAGVVRASGVAGGVGVEPDDDGGGVAPDPPAAGDGVPPRAEAGPDALGTIGVFFAEDDPALRAVVDAGAGAGFLVPGALGAGAATEESRAARMDARIGVAGEG